MTLLLVVIWCVWGSIDDDVYCVEIKYCYLVTVLLLYCWLVCGIDDDDPIIIVIDIVWYCYVLCDETDIVSTFCMLMTLWNC